MAIMVKALSIEKKSKQLTLEVATSPKPKVSRAKKPQLEVLVGEEHLGKLANEMELGCDLETSGLSPYKDKVAVISLYSPRTKQALIIHNKGRWSPRLKEFVASRKELITHNGAGFDILFMHSAGLDVFKPKWHDTMLAELALLSTDRRDVSVNLKSTLKRRTGAKISKDVDHSGWMNDRLTESQVNYCVEDISKLVDLKYAQIERADDDQLNAIGVENDLIPVIVKMVTNGVPIDVSRLKAFIKNQKVVIDRLRGSLAEDFNGPINLNSPVQIKKAMAARGWEMPSTNQETMEDQIRYGGECGRVCANILEVRHALQRVKMYTPEWVEKYVIDGRVHPKLWTCSTDTGRMSSSDPNAQQIPRDMRSVFGGVPGYKIVKCDACLHPDTPIETTRGVKRYGDVKVGDFVYSLRGRKIVCNRVYQSIKIKELPAYKLTFDNGESVIASSDHKWPILITKKGRFGGPPILEERKTEQLEVGQRIVPFKRAIGNSNGRDKYNSLYSYSSFEYSIEHLLVAEAHLGPKPEGYECHHKDENKRNNLPENLEYKLEVKHKSEHGVVNYQRQDHTKRIARLKEGIQNRRSYKGSGNPNFGKFKEPKVGSVCGHPFDPKKRGSRKYCSMTCYHTSRVNGMNHKLIKIEFLGLQPMHSIAVENDHNYSLAAGVVTYNSQIEVRVAASVANCPGLRAAFEAGLHIHTDIGSKAFGIPYDEIIRQSEKGDDTYKNLAKGLTFTMLFGGGWETFQISARRAGVELTEKQCLKIFDDFFRSYPGMANLKKRAQVWAQRAKAGKPIVLRLPTGLKRVLFGWKAKPSRIMNTLIQGGAAAGMKFGMLEAYRRGLGEYLVLSVHDELVACVPNKRAKDYAQELMESMDVGYETIMDVPSVCKFSIGDYWS